MTSYHREERLIPHQTIYLERLQTDLYLTAPVEADTMKKIVKNFKHKAPDHSHINKRLLEKLSNISAEYIRHTHHGRINRVFYHLM